ALRTLRPAPEAGPQSAPAPSTPTPTPPAAAAAAGAPPAVPHAPVLDAAALAELVEMGPAFTGRILPSFLRNAGDLAAGISAAAATADHAEVARLAHQLKGSSGTMAGRRLAAVCQAAEAAARQQDGAQVRVLAAAVDQATAELCRALQETVRPASPVD
ncbi:MAG TPA: Hpt domain-containing protein, partial [Pilimelia sp.]|nr:Hpt domain-containing protein [Pilimelia sp.]